MTVRAGYFLTDLLRDGMANLVVVPGSRRAAVDPPLEGLEQWATSAMHPMHIRGGIGDQGVSDESLLLERVW